MTAIAAGLPSQLRDLIQLAKPRLSGLVLFTTAGGYWLAPSDVGTKSPLHALQVLLFTALAVASANTFNCWIERHTDAVMRRTRMRPLPSGRVDPNVALAFAITLGAISVPALSLVANPLTGALGALAIVSYAAVYTPLKRITPHAVIVGSLPGAIPPLMGWTAVTNSMDPGGLVLFAVLFIWQIPHFLAIALYLQEDYKRAGMRVMPLVYGEPATRKWTVAYAVLLIPVTLLLQPMGLAGWIYSVSAAILGLGFVGFTLTGLRPVEHIGNRWSRQLMLVSIAYLGLLFVALALDVS